MYLLLNRKGVLSSVSMKHFSKVVDPIVRLLVKVSEIVQEVEISRSDI